MAIKNLAALTEHAHRALYSADAEYARARAFITQLFAPAFAGDCKEEARLTVIDSLYSTHVAATLWCGLPDIAQALRAVSPDDDVLRGYAACWVDDGFANTANPLHGLFAAQYGVNNRCLQGRPARSLLSKYLHFITHGNFPIYDKLGAAHYHLAGEPCPEDFVERFQAMNKIIKKHNIASFEKLDNFFWLYGKIQKSNFSLILNKECLHALLQYTHTTAAAHGTRPNDELRALIAAIRAGTTPAAASTAIFGSALHDFIRATSF